MAMDPSMPFYVNDWLSSSAVQRMNLVEQAAYLRLLCFCWSSGDCSLPDDDGELQELCGLSQPLSFGVASDIAAGDTSRCFSTRWELIRKQFIAHPLVTHCLTNGRLYEIWEERQKWKAAKAESGKAGAEKRWSGKPKSASKAKKKPESPETRAASTPVAVTCVGDSTPIAHPLVTQCQPNANPMAKNDSSSSLEEEGARVFSWAAPAEQENDPREPTAGDRLMFMTGRSAQAQEFIDAYPKKVKPGYAAAAYEAAIAKIVGENGFTDKQAHEWLIRRTREFARSPAATEPSGVRDYRTSPAEWLAGERYDEPDSAWRFIPGDAPKSTLAEKPRVAPLDPAKTLQPRQSTEKPPPPVPRPHQNLGDQLLSQLSKKAPF